VGSVLILVRLCVCAVCVAVCLCLFGLGGICRVCCGATRFGATQHGPTSELRFSCEEEGHNQFSSACVDILFVWLLEKWLLLLPTLDCPPAVLQGISR
jgi:hypothetical protein